MFYVLGALLIMTTFGLVFNQGYREGRASRDEEREGRDD